MLRQFFMPRRRPNWVDVVMPRQQNIDGYRLQWNTNFSGGSWTTLMTAPVQGFVDPAINLAANHVTNFGIGPYGPPVRVIFNPTTYSIPDTKSFWLRFVPMTGVSAGTPGAPTLILPDTSGHGLGLNVIHGTAPNGADSSASLQIDLPGNMRDFRIHNEEAATSLFVATEQDGPEVMLKFGAEEQLTSILAKQNSIWVRGGGATAVFSATFTLAVGY